jgi:hypothetical protein
MQTPKAKLLVNKSIFIHRMLKRFTRLNIRMPIFRHVTQEKAKGKGKAHPLQAMLAQRGLGELRLLDFLTSALYGGRLSASRTGRLYHQGHPWYSFSRGAESTPGPWFSRKEICH